jgi:cobyrinic acid a,c-diamide synthase
LGLVPREEEDTLLSALTACQAAIERNLDLEVVLQIARAVDPLFSPAQSQDTVQVAQTPGLRIGVLRDRAFTFYYPENLEALEKAGAELIFIDALNESELPVVDALFIGGGFPEIFMDELSANDDLRTAIKAAIENDLPVYAECGGLMYLSQRIRWGERTAEMVGALPCEIEMTGKPQGHGYVIAEVENENPYFSTGTVLRGHEFHNSRLISVSPNGSGKSPFTTAYRLSRGNGLGDGRDGIVYRNVLAAYTHLHVGGASDWAKGLVSRARIYQTSRQVVEVNGG